MKIDAMDVIKSLGEFASAVQKLYIEREMLEVILLEWIDKHDSKVLRDQPLTALLRQQIQVVEEKLAAAKVNPWPVAGALSAVLDEVKGIIGASAEEGARDVSKRLRDVLIGAEPGQSAVTATHRARAWVGAQGGESLNDAIARAHKALGAAENETVIEAATKLKDRAEGAELRLEWAAELLSLLGVDYRICTDEEFESAETRVKALVDAAKRGS